MPDWIFTWWWVVWLVVGFGVWEFIAIRRKAPGDTLSETVWRFFCLKGRKAGKSGWCMVRRIGFFAFWIWLSIHFLTGGAWM